MSRPHITESRRIDWMRRDLRDHIDSSEREAKREGGEISPLIPIVVLAGRLKGRGGKPSKQVQQLAEVAGEIQHPKNATHFVAVRIAKNVAGQHDPAQQLMV